MALTWIAPRNPGIAFEHGGSNNPGWECFPMGYADLHPRGKRECGQKILEDCGICVMTNSAAGFTVWAKIFHAVSYFKNWTAIPIFDGRTPIGRIPLCAYGVEVDERWLECKEHPLSYFIPPAVKFPLAYSYSFTLDISPESRFYSVCS